LEFSNSLEQSKDIWSSTCTSYTAAQKKEAAKRVIIGPSVIDSRYVDTSDRKCILDCLSTVIGGLSTIVVYYVNRHSSSFRERFNSRVKFVSILTSL